jgi:LacI family transcriptional regulator
MALQAKPGPDLRSIAKKAGVHYSTVSLALRKHPSIPVTTRQRILKIARNMGYRPNPLVSTLMTQVQASRKISYTGNIAFFFNSRSLMERHIHLQNEHNIVRERAEELGFNLELFFLEDYQDHGQKLFKTLKNRGIHAIITELFFPCPLLKKFEWNTFACASLGQSHSGEIVDPDKSLHIPEWVPTVSANYFSNISLLFRHIKKSPYRKPALAMRRFVDELTEHQYAAAFSYLCQKEGMGTPQNIYIGDETDSDFEPWLQGLDFDLLVSHEDSYYQKVLSSGYQADFITFDWKGGAESGIHIHRERIAAKVVDLVVAQLHRNERGKPPVPYNVLIDGTWHQGKRVESFKCSALSVKS